MTGERPAEEIGMHSLRMGGEFGDHEVIFGGPGERIEIRHRALSRDAFAAGAVRAARWLPGRAPGLYDISDVLLTP